MDTNQVSNETQQDQIQEILRFVRSAQLNLQNTTESPGSSSGSTGSSPRPSCLTSNNPAQGELICIRTYRIIAGARLNFLSFKGFGPSSSVFPQSVQSLEISVNGPRSELTREFLHKLCIL